MKEFTRAIPGLRPLYRAVRSWVLTLKRRNLLQGYLVQSRTAKLHIGCGRNVLPGWLNSDFYSSDPKILHFDATKRFPIEGSTFDYVFSEHMIEHVPHAGGQSMLKECSRVLKSNGRIRIGTPDLKFLVDLYAEKKSTLQDQYIKWSCDAFTNGAEPSDTCVINNFVRDWGHLFIYDEKTLRQDLLNAGFVDIQSFNICESDDPALRSLENEKRLPPGFVQLESFTLEARKP